MTLSFRAIFLIILGILTIWFLYLERAILTPFILAAIFAYIFNPLIDFLSQKIRLPRTLSITIIYLLVMAVIIFSGIFLARRVITESAELAAKITNIVEAVKVQVNTLPDWLSPAAEEGLNAFEKSKIFSPASVVSLFPTAISRIVSLTVLLFSAFYFLKEGKGMFDKVLNFVPTQYRVEVEILIRKINSTLSRYLRGQLFLVFIVSLVLFIALSIVGVRYALMLAVFSGFAEIVPIIGPIAAGTTAVLVLLITDTSFNFSLNQIQAAILVAVIYFVVRQFQDYFITPQVMGKITNLHPLVILFSVLAGGHLFGILGFLLAVPIVASLRILLEFTLDKLA